MTLTTVGYGDVLPHSSAARTMAMLEAVMGQVYLAVLVARVSRVAHRPYEQAADAGRQLSQFPQSSLAERINHQRANARAGKSQLTSAENKEQAPPLRRNPSPFAGRRRVR